MVCFTSLMIQSGVDAPAVMPIVPFSESAERSSSSAEETNWTLLQCSLQISARWTLFAL